MAGETKEKKMKTWRAWYHQNPEGAERADKEPNPFAARFSARLPEWATAVVKFPWGFGRPYIENLAYDAAPEGFHFHHIEEVTEF